MGHGTHVGHGTHFCHVTLVPVKETYVVKRDLIGRLCSSLFLLGLQANALALLCWEENLAEIL